MPGNYNDSERKMLLECNELQILAPVLEYMLHCNSNLVYNYIIVLLLPTNLIHLTLEDCKSIKRQIIHN